MDCCLITSNIRVADKIYLHISRWIFEMTLLPNNVSFQKKISLRRYYERRVIVRVFIEVDKLILNHTVIFI